MKCTHCGTELPEQSSFCISCGFPCSQGVVQSSLAADPIDTQIPGEELPAIPPAPRKKKTWIVPVVFILLLIIAALAVCYFFIHIFRGGSCDEPGVCVICGKEQDSDARHEWEKATCTSPQTCSVCGETKGKARGHQWEAATCTVPETCSVCGETKGEAKGHAWEAATCTAPETCSVCGETKGEARGHQWEAATCTTPETCSVCGETKGEAKGHAWEAATCTAPETCTVCGETVGEPLGHDWLEATSTQPQTCSRCHATSGSSLGLPLTHCQVIDESQSASGRDIVEGTMMNYSGFYHYNSLKFWVNNTPPYTNVEYRTYLLNSDYSVLSCTIALGIDSEPGAGVRFYFYDGTTLLYTSDYITATDTLSFEVDIRGVKELRIVCETDESCHSYGILTALLLSE